VVDRVKTMLVVSGILMTIGLVGVAVYGYAMVSSQLLTFDIDESHVKQEVKELLIDISDMVHDTLNTEKRMGIQPDSGAHSAAAIFDIQADIRAIDLDQLVTGLWERAGRLNVDTLQSQPGQGRTEIRYRLTESACLVTDYGLVDFEEKRPKQRDHTDIGLVIRF